MNRLFAVLLLFVAMPLRAEEPLDGQQILAKATDAHGGEDWANAQTLLLKGRAVFWGKTGAKPTSTPDSYIMHRAFDPDRQAAHGAEGKLLISVFNKGKMSSLIGFDGETTWTDKGIVPKEEADKMWASNFGFGIIRHVLKSGFEVERLADGNVDGFATYTVRLTDPTGSESLFAVDRESFAVRMVGFATPRGWHARTYGNFFRPESMPRWLQAGLVTLYYNGVKQNEIHWDSVEINGEIDPVIFSAPKQ